MTILGALTQKQIIEVATKDSTLMPGSPMTIQQLNSLIDKAERSPRLSVEEAKARLGL